MKKIGLLMLMLCLTGLTVGCEKKEPAAPPAAPPADAPADTTSTPETTPAS
ncbi:hypothetical protein [Aeoliella sp. SH292]|uniref:hypothetical protein n=1 Tax=Aeoliella sp. SH292 TaxID=3454464 RepID=UPI003F9C903A